MLAEITDLCEQNHFGVLPEAVNWSHVADLARLEGELKRVTDRLFKRGEYAAAD
jgi:hypothetical protein